ncbi:MAG: hypothetical protein TREMPRED_005046 [Tremellales sp. Tagirdzhanova-0007]|nr:MAG: hypothetical protein TREMPRED_005046 [Tremellales sp. Tagirdzhanova-0007]
MASPPNLPTGPTTSLASPLSMDETPLASSSPSPLLASKQRSRTAPPSLPPPNPIDTPIPTSEELFTSIPPPRPALDPDSDDISPPSSSSVPNSQHTTPTQPSALRRTSSSLSTGSVSSLREKKRLRFTPFTNSEAGPSALGVDVGDVIFPGASLNHAEQGRGRGMKGVPRDQAEWLGTSDPGTPNLQETADQIRRTLSLASLDHLQLVTANQAGERDRLIAQMFGAGKELVWRDEDEKRLLPRDSERSLILALKRGMRSFLLAFSVRAGVNVLLLLFRTYRRRRLEFKLLWHAMFGTESFRFGAMIGTFTFLNIFTLHLLRLAPPLSYFRRRLRLGLFTQATFGPPEREGNEGERRWQAAVAGAVGSFGLLWEAKFRRTGVAQQHVEPFLMFVRGLQGSYNLYTPRFGIHIPHGGILLFGACCGQIMYAWLCSPETIPKEYNDWILKASRVPEFGLLAHRTVMRKGLIEPLQVQRALQYKALTSSNRTALQDLLHKIRNGWKPDGAVPCEMIHPWCDSCTETNFRRFFSVFVYASRLLGAPPHPDACLEKTACSSRPVGNAYEGIEGNHEELLVPRRCLTLVTFSALFCIRRHILEGVSGMEVLRSALRRKETFWILGFTCSLSLFVEEKKRRAELGKSNSMYVLPRALESAWSAARNRAWVPIVPFGESMLGAAAMAMVMDAYKHQPDALSGVVRRLLFQLVGPV